MPGAERPRHDRDLPERQVGALVDRLPKCLTWKKEIIALWEGVGDMKCGITGTLGQY